MLCCILPPPHKLFHKHTILPRIFLMFGEVSDFFFLSGNFANHEQVSEKKSHIYSNDREKISLISSNMSETNNNSLQSIDGKKIRPSVTKKKYKFRSKCIKIIMNFVSLRKKPANFDKHRGKILRISSKRWRKPMSRISINN